MNSLLKKTTATALIAATALFASMIVCCLGMMPESRVEAATKTAKSMKLPSKMTFYTRQNNKWVKLATRTFKYDKKGNLVKLTDTRGDGPVKVKYKYKKKKLVSATARSKYTRKSFKFNKKGQLTYVKGKDLEENTTYTDTLQYDKRGYLAALKWTDSNPEYTYHKGTYQYTTTFGEGGNVTIDMTGKDFYGDLQASSLVLNKAGLLTEANYSGDMFSYVYTMSGKYVTRRVETIDYADGTLGIYRIDYKYSKTKAPAATYYMYINDDDRALVTNL